MDIHQKFFSKIGVNYLIYAIISLVFFILINILNIIPATNQVLVYVNNAPKICNSYFNLHYTIQKEATFGFSFFRNTGFFYESPKYSLILSICLMYDLFIAKELNKKEVLIFSLTIFSTLSLTGIALVVFIWILYFLFKENINNKTKLLKKILIILVLIVISPKMIDIASKVLAIKSDSASYSTRLDNYYAGYKAWKENPLFGSGYLDMSVIKKHYSAFRLNDIGYTNSPFRVLAQGGIYMSILYLATIIKGLLGSIKNRNIFKFFFVALFVYLFFTTAFSYNYLAFLVLFFISNSKYALKEEGYENIQSLNE